MLMGEMAVFYNLGTLYLISFRLVLLLLLLVLFRCMIYFCFCSADMAALLIESSKSHWFNLHCRLLLPAVANPIRALRTAKL